MKVICVIENGMLQAAWSDSPELQVELLDYDNMELCDVECENGRIEYEGYQQLEQEIEHGALHRVW